MNQLQILQHVKDYAKKENLTNFYLYTGLNSINEYTEEITLENLSQVIVGGTFLRKKLLIVPLLPFLKLDTSKHYIGLISTYHFELSQNKDVMISSLERNHELFKEFSETNKEIYFYSKKILEKRFLEVSYIFDKILAKKGLLIQQLPSITYNIYLNEMIDVIRIKNFSWIEYNLKDTLTEIQENIEVHRHLGVQRILFQKDDPNSNLTVSFIGAKDSKLIESFMVSLINKFIDFENDPNFSSSKEDLAKMISHTLLDQKILLKENKLKSLKI